MRPAAHAVDQTNKKGSGDLMSLIEEYHAAHKARLRRFAAKAIKPPKVYIAPAPLPTPAEYPRHNVQEMYYHNMWFYDLVTGTPSFDPPPPRIDDIIRTVARYFNVSVGDIVSARRTADIVRPRQVAYYLSRKLTLKSLPEIARRIGGRDHTSALSGIRKIDRLRAADPKLESDLHAIAACLAVSHV